VTDHRQDIDFAQHMKPVAERLLGQPNRKEGDRKQIWRYGRRNGSLEVNVEEGVWTEWDPQASGVTNGGVLDLIAFKKGLSNGAAVDWLRAEGLVDTPADGFDPLAFWHDGKPIRNTPAARYLRQERGLDPETVTPETARFHPAHRANGKPETKAFPAIVFPAYDRAGKLTAIQAVRLTPQARKLSVSAKISGGRIKGAALRAPGDRSAGIVLVEGPEDMLAVWQASGRECWATLGIANIRDAPLPDGCPVTICVDRGSEESTRLQARELIGRGHPVRLATPPEGSKDANEALKKHGAGAVVAMLDSAQALEPPARTDAGGRRADHDPALAERLSSFLLNDIGNAMRLVERFGASLRFVVNVGWHRWDGKRWQRDESQIEARRYAQRTSKAIFHECAFLADPDAAKERAKFAVRSGNDSRLSAMLSVSEPHLALSADAMDGNCWLLNCANGTLDLRTGEIRPHSQDDLLTRLAPVAYDPDAKAPTWESFLADVFENDRELISYVQKAVGYSLTGLTREQVLFIAHGGGSNGKTTFLEVLTQMVGDHSQQTPTETFMVKDRAGSIPNDIARLKGARLVTATETESGQRLAESLVKQATGGDKLVGRFMRQEFFEFTPIFKLWLATNHKPEIRGTDNAIWRRIRLIPFNVVFKDAEEAAEGEKVKDKTLPERLAREMPGILAWAVRGCLDWQKHGLATPPAVTKATGDYREEMDQLGEFLAECIEPARTVTIAARDVLEAYTAWCSRNGVEPVSSTRFGRNITERGVKRGRTATGAKGYEGIDIKSEFKPVRPESAKSRGYVDD
jgi:P4 family phage/plasmid primase-like protien